MGMNMAQKVTFGTLAGLVVLFAIVVEYGQVGIIVLIAITAVVALLTLGTVRWALRQVGCLAADCVVVLAMLFEELFARIATAATRVHRWMMSTGVPAWSDLEGGPEVSEVPAESEDLRLAVSEPR